MVKSQRKLQHRVKRGYDYFVVSIPSEMVKCMSYDDGKCKKYDVELELRSDNSVVMSIVKPSPSSPSALQPPSSPSALQPPSSPSALQPPSSPSALQPPSPSPSNVKTHDKSGCNKIVTDTSADTPITSTQRLESNTCASATTADVISDAPILHTSTPTTVISNEHVASLNFVEKQNDMKSHDCESKNMVDGVKTDGVKSDKIKNNLETDKTILNNIISDKYTVTIYGDNDDVD